MVSWRAFDDRVSVVGAVRTHASSEYGVREFCPQCGTGLFYSNPAILPGLVDIQTGTLDTPEDHAPGAQIMCEERLAWLDRIGALPAFAIYPGTNGSS